MVDPDVESTPATHAVGGINPDFDVEAHRGEAMFIGRDDLADARLVGYVGGANASKQNLGWFVRSRSVSHQ